MLIKDDEFIDIRNISKEKIMQINMQYYENK